MFGDDTKEFISQKFTQHSKVTDRPHDQKRVDAVNKEVAAHYKSDFRNTMAWYQTEVVPLLLDKATWS